MTFARPRDQSPRTRRAGNGTPPAPSTGPLHITVIGTGYVGLVSAACFATLGHHVTGVDSDSTKVHALQRGAIPIHEAGLQPLVTTQMRSGHLRFTDDLTEALPGADLVVIAVGTPAAASGATDLAAVESAIAEIGRTIGHAAAVVIKSTVPVGTTDTMQQRLQALLAGRGLDFTVPVLSNPEFLREGTATEDFLCPDRIIVGARTRAEAHVLEQAYAPLLQRGATLLVMAPRSAELSKYAANTMLATRISFMNEMADIAEATGADIEEVRLGIGSDRRIGPAFLRAGIGYGGSCFPKDVSSLQHQARERGLDPRLLDAVVDTNTAHARWPLERLERCFAPAGGLRGVRVAVWGLAFKPGTDDLRASPSLTVIDGLLAAGAMVVAHDPVAMRNAVALLPSHPGLRWAASAADALQAAQALLLLTEWPEFADFPPERAAAAMAQPLLLDGRNAVDADRWAAAGFEVLQVGRPAPAPGAGRPVSLRAPVDGPSAAAGTCVATPPPAAGSGSVPDTWRQFDTAA